MADMSAEAKIMHRMGELEQVQRMVDWKNPPTVSDLKQDLEEAQSFHMNHVAKVDMWLDALRAKPKFKPKEGRSRVQPKIVRKYTEWRIPSLEEPYLSAKDLFNISPASSNDVDAARQNKLVLNKQFRVDIPRTEFINNYIRKAVYNGTVAVKVGWEVRTGIVREEYDVIDYARTPEEASAYLQQLVQAGQLDEQQAQQLLMSGQPIPIGSHKETRRVEKEIINRPVLDVKDTRYIIVDPSCEGNIHKAKFIIDRFITDLATLKEDGRYSNLNKIEVSDNHAIDNVEFYDNDSKFASFMFKDKPRQKLIAYEYWGEWDIDGKGTLKPIVATWVGNVMIRLEENPFPFKKPPFVFVPYLPSVESSIYGEPDASLLSENQDIIGAVTRGMIDTMGRSANGQQAVAKGALDPINRDRFNNGENFEYNPIGGDPKNLFYMSVYPEIPQSALQILEMQNNEAEALTGIKAFNAGLKQNSLGDKVGIASITMDATAKRDNSILKRLSAGLVQVGRMIVAMNSVWLSDEEVIRISDEEFITIARDDLAGDFDLTIEVNTAELEAMKAQELAFLLQTLGNNIDFTITKMIMTEIAELRKMPHLAKAIREYEPQPDPLEQEAKQLQVELLRAQVANEQAKGQENQADVELKQAKAGSERAKADEINAKIKKLTTDTDLLDLDYIERANGTAHERELEKMLRQEEIRRNTALDKELLNIQSNEYRERLKSETQQKVAEAKAKQQSNKSKA